MYVQQSNYVSTTWGHNRFTKQEIDVMLWGFFWWGGYLKKMACQCWLKLPWLEFVYKEIKLRKYSLEHPKDNSSHSLIKATFIDPTALPSACDTGA